MIYTPFGAPIKITAVEKRTVKSPVKGRDPIPDVWFVKAKLIGRYPDGTGRVGTPVMSDRWFRADRLTADGGWAEIDDTCNEVFQQNGG